MKAKRCPGSANKKLTEQIMALAGSQPDLVWWDYLLEDDKLVKVLESWRDFLRKEWTPDCEYENEADWDYHRVRFIEHEIDRFLKENK